MMAIGGYFGLELRQGDHYHPKAIKLNTARNCLEYILRAGKYSKIYIPYYTCEVILEPIQKLHLQYEFYNINEQLEPVILPLLKQNEVFLYTNYFGLKQNCVERLASYYGNQLIVDNAQAFFAEPINGIDTFYSSRKFFGVADGAYLYTNKPLDIILEQDQSYTRMSHLLKRIDISAEYGYQDFKVNDASLCNQPIKRMSNITEAILCSIDYDKAIHIRQENYTLLAKVLDVSNKMHFVINDKDVPMVYPYLTDDSDLKQRLIDNKIYVATYWPNVVNWCNIESKEYGYAMNTIYIPIDQRYMMNEMQIIINDLIKK